MKFIHLLLSNLIGQNVQAMVQLYFSLVPRLFGYEAKLYLCSMHWSDSVFLKKKKKRPRRDSNPQSSDPKSDALSIRPRGRHNDTSLIIFILSWCRHAFAIHTPTVVELWNHPSKFTRKSWTNLKSSLLKLSTPTLVQIKRFLYRLLNLLCCKLFREIRMGGAEDSRLEKKDGFQSLT